MPDIESIYDDRDKPLATFLRGAVIDEVIAAYYYDDSGKRDFYTYFHDGLTSVTALADHTGAIQQTYEYSPFGKDRASTGSTPNRLKYTGREQDPSGFYYYRARYYDPETRRFLTEDPIGFHGGVNFYAYARNNPVNVNDPSGRIPLDTILDVAAIGYDIHTIRSEGLTITNGIALGIDLLSAAIPYVPALGQTLVGVGRRAGDAGDTVRRFVRNDEFRGVQAAIGSGDSVRLGEYFTPDAIFDPRIAASQLALPGVLNNPVAGFVDVPVSALPDAAGSAFGPRLVRPFRDTDLIGLPGGGLEVFIPGGVNALGDQLTLYGRTQRTPGLGAAINVYAKP
jgi:RHS repeat-associated protein